MQQQNANTTRAKRQSGERTKFCTDDIYVIHVYLRVSQDLIWMDQFQITISYARFRSLAQNEAK